jgi:hypothetical protein
MLNYTTQVPANKTIAQIQEILQKHGARSILTDLDSNGITALSFKVATKQLCTHPEGTICAACGGKGIIEVLLGIRLPADVQATLKVLKRTAPPRYGTEEHARNVAWRVIKNWIEAQLAIIETGMVSMEQVFLPYVVTDNGRTVFERLIVDRGLKLLAEGTHA